MLKYISLDEKLAVLIEDYLTLGDEHPVYKNTALVWVVLSYIFIIQLDCVID